MSDDDPASRHADAGTFPGRDLEHLIDRLWRGFPTSLRQAANSTGQKVLYLLEWPETSDQSCDPDVNVAPPLDFSNYQAKGF